MRIEHLHVQDRIDGHLHIVAGDADLFGNVERLLLEAVPVGNTLDERDQDMEPRLQGTAVLAQILDHVRTLLRHHGRGARDHDYGDDGERDEYVGCVHAGVPDGGID